MAKWTIRNPKANIAKMVNEFGISEIFATVLANRDILTRRKLNTYLYSDEKFFYDALEMKDMEKAFIKIIEAISKNELICIYGDYDVDGVTSTVILYKALKKIGANVIYYIPDREEEGYGLNIQAIDEVKDKGVDVIFTCDNGIASIEEVDYIKENNMDIIILDHHEPRFFEEENKKVEILPNADVIVNPKQEKCEYKFKALSAGGISYKFVEGIFKYMEIDENLDEYLVFASISTLCDIVDLLDENRLIVKMGLDILNNNKYINKGLFEILKVNNIEEKLINENDYGFIIGPCINASGRLESALKAVELFTTDEEEKIEILAKELLSLNCERKELTHNAVQDIFNMIENSDIKNDKVLVVYNDKIHESIAGIVAGRIKEIYYKPTFVITRAKDGAKGSGRSIPAYNMFEELLKCSSLFTKFGGHKMAAGLSLIEENIDLFRKMINENCTLTYEDFEENIVIDKALHFCDINLDLAKEFNKMKPIGKENKGAIFATKNVKIKSIRFVGKENNIIQFVLNDNTTSVKAISFDGYNKFLNILNDNISKNEVEKLLVGIKKDIDLKLDVVYSIDINIFNDIENVQLILKDFRIS
ncbi:single-stranded-DNA-specific exonuclease RecJ [[Clostridium] colinum]|uniref:single-stranded-DNA-specific exonuclease RecJ n=1 Tax=[Clostridium] colinum TaxID=36835 RepID=UPI002023D1DE|nr:single-stranded-DNA-specific exonuclease RecJ [[Clostridium] colinum]